MAQESFEVDRTAPVFAAGEVFVVAPADVVWDVIANVGEWPGWQPGISQVELDGPVQVGTTFHWRSGRSKIVSTFREVDRPNAVGWIGKTFGVRAQHKYEVFPDSGGVRLKTEESWRGPLASLLRKKLRVMLAEAVDTGLANAKEEAERRATTA